ANGSATLFPSGMSIVRAQITKKQAQAIAIVSVFSSTSAAFGPTIGGFLIAEWHWPSIFLINIPIIIIGLSLAIFVLPKASGFTFELKRIDFFGIFLFTISVLGLILFLLSLSSTILWLAVIIFSVGGILVYNFEERKKDAFIDVNSLRLNKNIHLVFGLFMLINFVYYSYFFGVTTLLLLDRGYSESNNGFIKLD